MIFGNDLAMIWQWFRQRRFTHQYGCHDKSLILQVFNDLSVNVAVAPREVDTFGTIPSTDFLQALFTIQFDDV